MTGLIAGVAGTWALTIATPIGKLPITVELQSTAGVLHGTATGRGETVPFRDVGAGAEAGTVTGTRAATA